MSTEENPRRRFLKNIVRFTLLGAMTGGIGALVSRRGETCVNAGICRGCSAFSDCGLPQALSAKEATARGEGWRNHPKK
ncbi:MAG: hypothetical protein ACYDBB_15455 [Armatimonadota bacterium]